jgi:glyoxylase-like metal-dependent hydrolase (beta-lactamase superfamily II)
MQHERVSENVYWFQSEVYAQVTAGAVTGTQWAVVIDTLAMPEETLQMRQYIEEVLGMPVRYVINTHYHADHTWGNCFFPGATVLSHSLCRKFMQEKAIPALEATKQSNPSFSKSKIVLPQLTFNQGTMSLRVGKKNLILMPTPGHSTDGISVLIEEDRVLFAGDAFMPLPYIVDGNIDTMGEIIKQIGKMGLENIVQGHGDIILRGEIEGAVKENLAYLANIRKAVKSASKKRNPEEVLSMVDIESCGKSRVYLGGLGEDLHRRNLKSLYMKFLREGAAAFSSEDLDDKHLPEVNLDTVTEPEEDFSDDYSDDYSDDFDEDPFEEPGED